MSNTIKVSGNSPYEVIVGQKLGQELEGFLQGLDAKRALLVTQENIRCLAEQVCARGQAAGLQVEIMVVPDAEFAKDVEVLAQAWNQCAQLGLDRRDLIIGVGGGAVTDLAGFIAATWMRGIRVIQVPTTLLAMVDAAVGGKTGINTPAGKNLVGAFHEPTAVFVDLDYLHTLPRDEFVSGSAEIIKTGFIADPEILRIYQGNPQACLEISEELGQVVHRSIAVKARVVGQDLKESSLREILNYGHTFGHAIEHYENYHWRHGNAVAVGMMFVANLAVNRGIMTPALLEQHRNILSSIGLPVSYRADEHVFPELLETMKHDKKNRGDHIRFVVLRDIAQVERLTDATREELEAAFTQIQE